MYKVLEHLPNLQLIAYLIITQGYKCVSSNIPTKYIVGISFISQCFLLYEHVYVFSISYYKKKHIQYCNMCNSRSIILLQRREREFHNFFKTTTQPHYMQLRKRAAAAEFESSIRNRTRERRRRKFDKRAILTTIKQVFLQ